MAALAHLSVSPALGVELKDLKDPKNSSDCVSYYVAEGKLLCSNKPVEDEKSPADPVKTEKVKLAFDERIWRAAWANVLPAGSTVEYVVDGEKVGSWTELVTSQVMTGLAQKVDAAQFGKLMLDNLQGQVQKLTTTVHSNNPKDSIVEFNVLEPQNMKQSEIQRIFVSGQDIIVVHYAKKGEPPSDAQKKKWIELLQKAKK